MGDGGGHRPAGHDRHQYHPPPCGRLHVPAVRPLRGLRRRGLGRGRPPLFTLSKVHSTLHGDEYLFLREVGVAVEIAIPSVRTSTLKVETTTPVCIFSGLLF